MATRTIPSATQRLVTMLVAPLMTCSSRLPVYALLIGAFVPAKQVLGPLGLQGLTLLGLYLLGAVGALVAAAILGRTLVKADAMPFYLELPPYRLPTARLVVSQVWGAASRFLKRAGTIILAVSIVLWALLTFPRVEAPAHLGERQAAAYALEHSAGGRIGRALEPAIAPLGFDWKIGIGLVASLAAREVIVSTLAQIYAASGEDDASLRDALAKDRDANGAPVYTPAAVAALLVFFVFALQCTSTIATLARETNSWRWPAFAFLYLLAIAYGAAFAANRIVGALSA
jgi:ferrous iron transport protein B